MAALDLSTKQSPWTTARADLESSAGNVREVKLPQWCRRFTVNFRTSANADDSGRVASAGTDTAAIGNDVFPCPSGSALSFAINPTSTGTRSIYITGDTASGYAYILLEAV